jgi:insulysin
MMILPKNETRVFHTDILKNGVKTICVYDKDTEKTSVTVSVNIGSYMDPKDSQGLAHFLEHMLFLGSKKYSNEEYYQINVKKYGGHSNAWTDLFETVYYFSVFNDGVEHLMDIFSRFFIDPLFNENSVQREINAVNSEHEKNINDDNWRTNQVIRNLAKQDNNYNTFATGSNKTMDNKTIRNEMIEFYNKYYVSENISICIVSNINIKKQQELLKATFGKIPKKLKNNITIKKPIYNNFGETYQMIPVSDIQKVIYTWEIKSGIIESNKIYEIISELLIAGHKKSFTNFLKVSGLAESCYTNIQEEVGIFSLYINLTKLGLSKLNQIDGYVKYTINKIFSQDLYKYIKYYKKIYEIIFDNSDKSESVELSNMMAINAHKYNLTDLLSGPNLISYLEPIISEEIKQEFSKCIKLLISQDNKITKKIIDKNYGTEYGKIQNIQSLELSFDLEFNINNLYLDLKIQNLKLKDNLTKPILIKNRYWYSAITKFNEPSIKGGLFFNNSKYFNTPKSYVYTILALKCLAFYLGEELFNIFRIKYNISFNIYHIYNSIGIFYFCLNDTVKLNDFINTTLKLIKSPKIPDIIIDSYISSLKEDYININKDNPWDYSSYYISSSSTNSEYLIGPLLKELKKINKKELLQFISTLFDDSPLTVLFSGALIIDELPNISFINKGILLPQNGFALVKTLPKEINIYHPNKEEKSNCISIIYELGIWEPKLWLHAFITCLILEQPFFDELRTKKQLGYLVSFNMSSIGDNYYLIEKIQSDKDCTYLLKEINIFNENINKIINKSNLQEWKISAKNYLDENEDNAFDIFNKFLSEIMSRKYFFNRKEILIQQLSNVTIKSLLEFVKKYLLDNKQKCIFQLNGN